jgi:hypothetical protein
MERRRKPRRSVAADEPLSNARLRTGGQLRIVDASSWGALAETAERLLPGRQLDIHVMTTQGRTLVRCRVIRAFVARLTLDSIHFHVALAFDRALDVHVEGYPIPDVLGVLEVEPGKRYPVAASPADIEFTDVSSA